MDEAIGQLQREMAQIDLLIRQRSKSGSIEFLIIKKQNLKIKMYQEQGHSEPHVHIDYGNGNHVASFSVSDGRRLCGNLDRKYEKLVKLWIYTHKEQLNQLWIAAQSGSPVEEIIVGIKDA
jgi:hypothetical protein